MEDLVRTLSGNQVLLHECQIGGISDVWTELHLPAILSVCLFSVHCNRRLPVHATSICWTVFSFLVGECPGSVDCFHRHPMPLIFDHFRLEPRETDYPMADCDDVGEIDRLPVPQRKIRPRPRRRGRRMGHP